MNNEIKHYNHNHGKDDRFTFGSRSSRVSSSSNKKINSKKMTLSPADGDYFAATNDMYSIGNIESGSDYPNGTQIHSSNSPSLKKKFPHLEQNSNTRGVVWSNNNNASNPVGVLHIKKDKNGINKIDLAYVYGDKNNYERSMYKYDIFDMAKNHYKVPVGNKEGEVPPNSWVTPFEKNYDSMVNKKIESTYTNNKGEFEYGLSARKEKNMNKKNFIQHGRGPSKRHKYVKIINGKYIYPEDLIKKGKDFVSDTKDAAEIKAKELILKGKKEGRKLLRDSGYADYSGPEGLVKRGKEFISDAKDTADINYRKARLKTKKAGRPVVRKIPRTINDIESRGRKLKKELVRDYNNSKNNRIIKRGAVAPIVKRVDYERRIDQKNGGYNTPKSRLEKHAENIVRINQRNGKFTKRKNANNAVGTIANAARTARRNTVRPNSYGHDRTNNYGRPKMNTASNAAERAINSMKMPKVRKVKKSKLKEFMSKFEKKKKKGLKIKTNDGDTRILSSTVRYR